MKTRFKKLKNIVGIGSNKSEILNQADIINRNMRMRRIGRIAHVIPVSRIYVKSLTRKGFAVPKKNYGIVMKDKIKRSRSSGIFG